MKYSLFAALSLAGLLAAGCSSTPTHVESGVIPASTFSFVAPGPRTLGIEDSRQPVHAMIQDAITKNLEAKGLHRVASGGDVTVAYLVVIGDSATTETINTYFGYGRDSTDLEQKAHAAYNSSKNPNYFEAGTLLVDFLDGKTHKLLKRSYVVRRLLRNSTAEVRAGRLEEAVDSVLKDAHFAQK